MKKNGNDTLSSRGSQPGERLSPVLAVLRRFPSQGESIERLYGENDSFQDLCGDYRDAVEALGRLQGSRRPEETELLREYRALCLRLECELLRYLEKPRPERGPDAEPG